MHITILIVLTLPTIRSFKPTIDPVLKRQDFVFSQQFHAPEGTLDLLFTRKVDRHFLEMEVKQVTSQQDLDQMLTAMTNGNAEINAERSPSGLPLGDHSYVMSNGQELIAAADGFYVKSEISAQKDSYSAGDERALEAVSRIALAEMIGNTLRASGSPIPAEIHTNQHPHTFYKPLSQIAKTTKIVPVVGEWFDHCTVQLGKHKLEFVLASDAVAIDGKWTFVEAFVARQNGVWMIPTKVLKQKGIEGF